MLNSDRLEFFFISLRYFLKDLNKNILFSISEAPQCEAFLAKIWLLHVQNFVKCAVLFFTPES